MNKEGSCGHHACANPPLRGPSGFKPTDPPYPEGCPGDTCHDDHGQTSNDDADYPNCNACCRSRVYTKLLHAYMDEHCPHCKNCTCASGGGEPPITTPDTKISINRY